MALMSGDLSRGRFSLGLSLCPRLLEVHVAIFVFLFAFGLFLLGCLVFVFCLHCLPAAVVFWLFIFPSLFIYGGGHLLFTVFYSTVLCSVVAYFGVR